ncbi:MAG: hypothetical protein HY056_13535 [Proteobacteria bacterium]|nr:hypothetical protein [Pseudomonadota bacterium]
MALTIRADDGDELTVQALQLFDRQIHVRLELHNSSYLDEGDYDWITLTAESARALGEALIRAAGLVEPQFDNIALAPRN